jgi:hypothetical protein
VHFFVHNNDAGKRQKLIDLFIQERHAKQQGDAGRALSLQAMARAQLELVGQLALIEQKKVEKVEPKAKPGWVDLDAKRRQLEAELKRLEAELDSLKAQAALSEKTRDLETTRLRLARTRVLEQLRTTQGTATNKVLKVELDRDSRGVVGLQDAFFRALIGAAKDKKEAVAITQEYLDSLMKYAKANPKANDAADAILQIELVYRALGKTVEADAWRDKLKKDYPTSPAWKHRQSSQPRINSLWLIEDAQLDEIEVYFALPARKEPPAKSR